MDTISVSFHFNDDNVQQKEMNSSELIALFKADKILLNGDEYKIINSTFIETDGMFSFKIEFKKMNNKTDDENRPDPKDYFHFRKPKIYPDK